MLTQLVQALQATHNHLRNPRLRGAAAVVGMHPWLMPWIVRARENATVLVSVTTRDHSRNPVCSQRWTPKRPRALVSATLVSDE